MRWLQFILSHSLFIAFCAVAMAFQTNLLTKGSGGVFLYGFLFFSTLCSYNFYWLLCRYTFNRIQSLPVFLTKELPEIAGLILSGTVLLICYFYSGLKPVLVLPAMGLTILYSMPLLPFRFLHFTRKAGILKTTVLAAAWTYVTAFLPYQKAIGDLDSLEWFILTRRFLFMLMLCIIFDSRDMAVDKIRGLRSLATDLSPKTLRILIWLIFILLFGSNFLFRYFGLTLAETIALQISTIALLVAYYYSTRKQGYLFYYFFVDGLMLFSALATYLATI